MKMQPMGFRGREARRRTMLVFTTVLAISLGLGGIMVRAAGSSENPPPPATVGTLRTPPRSAETVDPAAGRSKQFHTGFFEVLRQYGSGESQSSEAMAELQRQAFQSESLAGLAKLHKVQLAVAKDLAARNTTCYRPIVWLQYQSSGRFTTRDEYALRVPSLMLAVDLAASMRRSAESVENQRFATDVMVCSAHSLLRDGNKTRAAGLFDRVIRLEPSNAPALLGSAAIHERHGRHEEAVRQLRRLIKAHPKDSEGRLRLAVNLARLEETEDSDRILHGLVADSDLEWVRIVAYQELVRDLVARHQLKGAEQVLLQATAEHPENHSLQIQHALVLDLMGRPYDAAQVVEAIQPELANAGASPRWIYAEWPSLDVETREDRLRDLADTASPALAEALHRHQEAQAS